MSSLTTIAQAHGTQPTSPRAQLRFIEAPASGTGAAKPFLLDIGLPLLSLAYRPWRPPTSHVCWLGYTPPSARRGLEEPPLTGSDSANAHRVEVWSFWPTRSGADSDPACSLSLPGWKIQILRPEAACTSR